MGDDWHKFGQNTNLVQAVAALYLYTSIWNTELSFCKRGGVLEQEWHYNDSSN